LRSNHGTLARVDLNEMVVLARVVQAGSSFGVALDTAPLRLENKNESKRMTLRARMVVNDNDILHAIAIATPVHALYPSTRRVSPKVKSFIDHLQKPMNPAPWDRTRGAT
jgi:hypothetical protein